MHNRSSTEPKPIGEYSLGTRAKIAIAAALLGAPPLLVFDESLNGLDPVAAWEVKVLLSELAASGKHGVIVSTHVVESVQAGGNEPSPPLNRPDEDH